MRLRIIIFEDNDMLRSTLKHLLEELGYEVYTFSNPGMCHIYKSANYNCSSDLDRADIIISDVNMPIKTGLEFIKDLLQNGCKIKYRALMSGDWSDSDLRYAQDLGCRVFHKPFKLEEMLEWIDDCGKRIEPERVLSDWFIN